jgi:hypothetical protein
MLTAVVKDCMLTEVVKDCMLTTALGEINKSPWIVQKKLIQSTLPQAISCL